MTPLLPLERPRRPVPGFPRAVRLGVSWVGLAGVGLLGLLGLAGCEAGTAPEAAAPLALELEAATPPSVPGAGMPFVAAGDGRFWLSWTEPTGTQGPTGRQVHAVRFASVTPEGGWSEAGTLAASDRFFVNWADFPSIASAGEGRLAAHWLARSGEGTYDYDVVVATSEDGGARWSEPRILHSGGVPAEHGFVSFFPAEGGFGAVWLDGRETVTGGPMTLRAGHLSFAGVPGEEHLLDDRICDCCQTGAAVTSEGVVAVYRGRSAGEVRDILAVRRVNGAWEAPVPIHDDGWTIPACPVNGPAVAAEGRRVVAAWFTGADDIPRVRVAFSEDAGARWSEPVEADEGAPLGRVDVVLLADGSALLVWLDATEEDAALLARRIHPDGTMEASRTLALTSQVRASGFPRMARLGDRVLLSWTEPAAERGGRSTLRAAFLDVAVAPR
jgi:hypothetical protein